MSIYPLGIEATGDFDDVPKMVSELAGMNESTTIKWLNNKIVAQMTYDQLCEIDLHEEIGSWFSELSRRLDVYTAPFALAAPTKEAIVSKEIMLDFPK